MTAPGMKIMMGLAPEWQSIPNLYTLLADITYLLPPEEVPPHKIGPETGKPTHNKNHCWRVPKQVSRPASPTSSVQPVQSILSVQSPARPFSITLWDNLRHFASFYSHTPLPRCNHTSIHTGLPCRHQGFQRFARETLISGLAKDNGKGR